MTDSSDVLDLLRCPRCSTALRGTTLEVLNCTQCGARFPLVAGIPWLFADPGAALSEWRQRLQFLVQHLEAEAARTRAELDKPDLRAPTRSRLKLLAHGYQDQARRLQALLAPLMGSSSTSLEAHLALRTRLPSSQGLTSYYSNIHRDWAWGEAENEASCAEVAAALGDHSIGKTLILGAGACRLAYDIHQRCKPELTIAADINPLLLLVAAKLFNGEQVSLYEFPIAPKSAEENAILRTLAVQHEPDERFQLVFADAMHAPFKDDSFDTVITPWFIDIIPEDFAAFAPRVNQLLRPGGLWINFGSLAFAQPEAASCYSLQEVLAIVHEHGFAQTHLQETTIPYMRSPASRHSRLESVITFGARKDRAASPPPAFSSMPDWLISGTQPVPLSPAFQSNALSTRIYAFIMSLIDGKRSLREMAAMLVQQRMMAPEDAETALRGFLIRMYEESRQRRDF